MRYLIKFLPALLLLAVAISPVAAIVTNVSAGSVTLSSVSYLHDEQYMPISYVYALVVIGLLSLLASRVFESAEDIFSIGAVAPCGFAMWFSRLSTMEYMLASPLSGTDIGTNVQIITPAMYLFWTMLVFFLLSIANVVWIFLYKNKTTDSNGA